MITRLLAFLSALPSLTVTGPLLVWNYTEHAGSIAHVTYSGCESYAPDDGTGARWMGDDDLAAFAELAAGLVAGGHDVDDARDHAMAALMAEEAERRVDAEGES